ncbi:MAG: hypothetical protein ACE5J2_07860 [Nitrososphaerales archaeon]
MVEAVLSPSKNPKVKSTNPGAIFEKIVIDGGDQTINSIEEFEELPINWELFGSKVRVYFVDQGGTVTDITNAPEVSITITDPDSDSMSLICDGTEGTVEVDISNISDAAGEPLGPEDKIIILKHLKYSLKGELLSDADDTQGYPCVDEDRADVDFFIGADSSDFFRGDFASGVLIVDEK